MNPERKKEWVEALRSGQYHQGRARLKKAEMNDDKVTNIEHCCLGVACELAVKAGVIDPAREQEYEPEGVVRYFFNNAELRLPVKVQTWLGVQSKSGGDVIINGYLQPLAFHNDNGATFAQIADAIEQQL